MADRGGEQNDRVSNTPRDAPPEPNKLSSDRFPFSLLMISSPACSRELTHFRTEISLCKLHVTSSPAALSASWESLTILFGGSMELREDFTGLPEMLSPLSLQVVAGLPWGSDEFVVVERFGEAGSIECWSQSSGDDNLILLVIAIFLWRRPMGVSRWTHFPAARTSRARTDAILDEREKLLGRGSTRTGGVRAALEIARIPHCFPPD